MARTKDVVLAPEQKELMEKEYLPARNVSECTSNNIVMKWHS